MWKNPAFYVVYVNQQSLTINTNQIPVWAVFMKFLRTRRAIGWCKPLDLDVFGWDSLQWSGLRKGSRTDADTHRRRPEHYLKRVGVFGMRRWSPSVSTSPSLSKSKKWVTSLLSFLRQKCWQRRQKQHLSAGARSQPGEVINREKKCRSAPEGFFCLGHS